MAVNQDDNLLINSYLKTILTKNSPIFMPVEFVVKPECN
jgi:hypothetical protein